MFAGSTASTRSSRCASPSAATLRSRSTTSAAPPGSSKRDDDFAYMEHVAQTTPEGIQADVGAAVGYLRDAGSGIGLHRRVLLRRPQLVALGRGRPRARRRGRLLRDAGRAERASRARRSARPRSPRRSWRCRRATTRTSRPSTTRRSTRLSPPPGSSTRSSPIRVRRTASSTASTRSTRPRRTTRGRRTLAFVERYS